MSDPHTLESPQEVQVLQNGRVGRGHRLTKRAIALCLELANAGKSGREIAQVLQCHESTVSRTLDQWGDNRQLARKLLEAKADRLARTVIESKNADVALRALGKLDVVREDAQPVGNTMVVVLGSGQQQLEPPAVTVEAKVLT